MPKQLAPEEERIVVIILRVHGLDSGERGVVAMQAFQERVRVLPRPEPSFLEFFRLLPSNEIDDLKLQV